MDEISKHWQEGRRFIPKMSREDSDKLYSGWKRAVDRAKGWADADK